MNIWALEGHKVKISVDEEGNVCGGYDYDKEKVEEFLKPDVEYTVTGTIVQSSSTEVYLEGFSNKGFNSVCFVDCVEQSAEDDKEHLFWDYYNSEEEE